ncbi:hypothetical protein MAPG_02574 [Magnaporthiopsis poae ATCC 64411]|uniref:Uncharacterized protein n=1 Tax=Magnaporthiopsis poae (strain ATCC 64411 / 73-15) TaxID=644358 RepID=A0A0C4DRQ9_MAGP6|nr:hypothetical protein MAPG_02574 [Magnaporthiopsis poae ATCC 64411]
MPAMESTRASKFVPDTHTSLPTPCFATLAGSVEKMHEVITLQLGQPSNYLATHFWNAQEAYFTYSDDEESPVNHDVHWRPGIATDGSDTYMPRTVIYDLKGGFGSMRKINALYDAQDDQPPQALWNGKTVVQKQTPIEVAEYQQSLEKGEVPMGLTPGSVRYWSDFNRVFMHPRSVVQLNDYELNSSIQPFERWQTGEELFAELDKEHDLLDRDLRPFVEEADHMQAIQVFTTIDDAWGGFASRYAERLRDEYAKSVVWVWGLQDSGVGLNREKRLLRMSNKARTLTELYKQASVLIPFSMPRSPASHRGLSSQLDTTSRWHTSALLATALETATLPSRLKRGPNSDSMDGMAEWLNVMGKQTIATLQMDVVHEKPDDSSSDPRRRPDVLKRYAIDGGYEYDGNEDTTQAARGMDLPIDFTAHDEFASPSRQNGHKSRRHIFGQTVAVRGISPSEEDAPTQDRRFARQHQGSGKAAVRSYFSDLRFPQPDSFPLIYATASGEASKGALPIIGSLTTDSATSDRLKLLRANVARSIGVEDREALSNELAQMAEEYHEGWSSGSDDGDDD